jgi:methionyl-tRNA formyltransferase
VVYTLVDEVVRSLGHRVGGVVTSPGPPRRRSDSYLGVVAAVPPGVDVLVSNHPSRWAAMLAPLCPDLIICGGMPWLIPPEVITLPRLGTINFHPALLPRYRGPASIDWAFRNGDPEMGFTIHWMSPQFDTGAILAQVRFPIDDEADHDSLGGTFGPLLPGLLREALERVARGDPGEPQDEAAASHAGLFEDEWRTIDWGRPARTVHNQVRSWTGFRGAPMGALGEVDGEVLQITKTRLLPDEVTGDRPPGTVLHRDGERLVVQCGDGSLELVAWERSGSGQSSSLATPGQPS